MLNIADVKGKIDFGIITVREDEFRAVLKRFPRHDVAKKNRHYAISYLPTLRGIHYTNAIVACAGEGHKKGQKAAQQMIDDLDPNWLLLIGIGGAVPDYEFTLGDVVAATRLQDFSVSADVEGQERQYDQRGGEMHPAVIDILKFLPAMDSELSGWNDEASIGKSRPPVQLRAKNFYGDDELQADLKKKMNAHFGAGVPARVPKVVTGSVASSDALLKNTQTLRSWLNSARKVNAVEMELAGVYEAAQNIDRLYPILAIRGISDIVGFKRDPAWTDYACHSAAAFAYHLLKTGFNKARASEFAKQRLAAYEQPGEAQSRSISSGSITQVQKIVTELSETFSSHPRIYRDECDDALAKIAQISAFLNYHWVTAIKEYTTLADFDYVMALVGSTRGYLQSLRDTCPPGDAAMREEIRSLLKEIQTRISASLEDFRR
jgi:nucleoside phosphorylase